MEMKFTRFPKGGGISFLRKGSGTGGDGLSPGLWYDCPLLHLMTAPTLGVVAGDDFTFVGTTGNPYKIVGTNGTFTAVAGAMYGQAKLTCPGTDNDECYVTSNNNIAGLINANANKQWWFEARVKLSQVTAAQGVFVGLAEETGVGLDFMTDDTMAMKVLDSIGFQIIAATDIAAVWQTMMQLNGGARVAINATAATGTVNFVKLGMRSVPNAAGTVATVSFWVDGIQVSGTVLSSATNFPLNKVMQITFATKTGKTAANSLTLDWWQAAQLR
jgi:hypothetical protein